MATRANCWEVKKCGRQPGGGRVVELGACPAAQAHTSGLNGGIHAGRICWAIAGTLCGGKIQGTFAQKVANCMACEFYRAVRQEEGSTFMLMPPA
ncbi:MAG: two-CW domain-containing protein [Bryobacteraceae bacterium]